MFRFMLQLKVEIAKYKVINGASQSLGVGLVLRMTTMCSISRISLSFTLGWELLKQLPEGYVGGEISYHKHFRGEICF